MGKCNVVSQNLLPLLKTYPADSDIVYHASKCCALQYLLLLWLSTDSLGSNLFAVRVLVLMSMPPQDLYPTNVKDIHQAIKADFLDSDALGILLSMCHEPLRHLDDLTDSQYKILQMFITFVRNMMIIPDSTEVAASTTKNHHSTLQVFGASLLWLPCLRMLDLGATPACLCGCLYVSLIVLPYPHAHRQLREAGPCVYL